MPEPYSPLSLATIGESHGGGNRSRQVSAGAAAGLACGRSCGCGGSRFRRSCRSGWLVGSSFRFRLNRTRGSGFHAARGCGLIRRRLRFTFRRRRGGFGFVRHNAKAQTSGAESVEKNVNFYQLERAKSTSREMTGEIAPRWPGRGKRGPGKGFAQCSLKNIPSTRMYVHNR